MSAAGKPTNAMASTLAMFARQQGGAGWAPFEFQQRVWAAQAAGRSGLVHSATGSGKTLAVWMPALEREAARRGLEGNARTAGCRVLWITPMRALAGDTLKALAWSAAEMGLAEGWAIEARTGDTPASLRKRQRERLPATLVTTPESLAVLLSYPGGAASFAGVELIVVDEWHELLGTKRGVQTELLLAELRAVAPAAMTWGLSATLGNVDEALRVLLGSGPTATRAELVRGLAGKAYQLDTLVPADVERFPWAGHLGLRLLPAVLERIESARSTLLFTNTRGQAEIWFQSILRARPAWMDVGDAGEGQVAIHHGSLDRELRAEVERRVKEGSLRCVVCTSSLDLGVDFPPVDQVIQIGSPKGVGRLLQRAGRSGHRPGMPSRVVCVPAHGLELVEFAAMRDVLEGRGGGGSVEARAPLRLAFDVLSQHLLTLAAGAGAVGIDEREVLARVRTTHAFAELTDEQWGWVVRFARQGGSALGAYERFARLVAVPAAEGAADGASGRLAVASELVAREHRLGIGTIVSEPGVAVRWMSGGGGGGGSLGTVEESFIARLSPGDRFALGGRRLELVRVREMTAFVRAAPPPRRGGAGTLTSPSWNGGRMPLSSELSRRVRDRLAEAEGGEFRGSEMQAVAPILRLQAAWSRLPTHGRLLIEQCRTREGWHAFVFAMAGRLAHEGLAALLAFRFAREQPRTFSIACGDYGLELLCAAPPAFAPDEQAWRRALAPEGLADDLIRCVNASQLARRQFREVARVAGLLVPGYPGQRRGGGGGGRQRQASSELFFDVFTEFDPENLLLEQCRREVLERQLEVRRLHDTLTAIQAAPIEVISTERLTPFSFPLWADRLREQLTSERWSDRVARMLAALEADARGGPSAAEEPDSLTRPAAPAVPGAPIEQAGNPASPRRGGRPGRWRRPRL